MTERDPALASDLAARARRGLLSEAEEAAFARELERDPTLSAAHRVGLDLDRSTAVRAGDEALIARAADGALGRVRASGLEARASAGRTPSFFPKRRRRIPLFVAAALVCMTGMAAGMWRGAVPAWWFSPKVESSETSHGISVTHRSAPPKPPAEAPRVDTAAPEPSSATPAPAVSARETAPIAKPQRSPRTPEATAQSIFKSANAARRDGDFPAAERLYSELIGRYPSSDEAGLARVSLGKLLLASGDPSDAEREFDRYLKGGRGQLTEEALVNRAESLRKMGRAKAERATWQTLLAEYPSSVYAAEAKGRLDALKSEAPAPAP